MKIIDVSSKFGQKTGMFQWTKDYLLQVLTQGHNAVAHTPEVRAAFSKIDRKDFVPEMLRNRAYEDVDLDIGFEETLTRPTVIAQMLELLKPKLGGNYLDIGTGTGYFAILLGFIAGDQGMVYSLERVQWLWESARTAASFYPDIKNVKFLYKDGSQGLIDKAPYDGIHVSFTNDEMIQSLKMQLKMDGSRLVVPSSNQDLRVIERHGEQDFIEEIVPGFVFSQGKVGVG